MTQRELKLDDRVVITGIGLATCLGLTTRETWNGVLESRRGIGAMPALESPVSGGDKPRGNGGQAPDLSAEWLPGQPREVRYLRWVIEEALRQASLSPTINTQWPAPPDRCACFMGTTLHGMRQGGHFLRTGDFTSLCSFLASHTMAASLRGLPVGGLAATNCSACSSGLGAIALGASLLRSGQADMVIAGGYDPVSEYAFAGFDSMRLVAAGDLRPFCSGRDGMKLAEGYAALVLERGIDAADRGATVLAEVRGIGESADSHHLTQPHPEGEGALRAILAALRQADLTSADIGLIAAHATATPNNDASEFAALSRAMAERLPEIPVVAFKSHLGHTLGAAGAAELILSVLAMHDQISPPTANVSKEQLEFPTLSISPRPRRTPIRATLNTSLGFGGANTCVVLAPERKAAAPAVAAPNRAPREVLITGVGFLAPGMIGNEALVARLSATPNAHLQERSLSESEYAHLINARRVRRLSEYSKLTLAATSLACQNAGITDVPLFAESCSAILGTTHGAATFCRDYYKPIVEQGMAAANPVLFAEGVPNAASAQLSLMLGIKGCCQTIIGSRTAGLDALRLAALRIASGEWDRAIVGAAEEDVDVLQQAYAHAGLRAAGTASAAFNGEAGFVTSSGAASLVLESRSSLEARASRRVLGIVGQSAAVRGDLSSRGPGMVGQVLAALGDPGLVMSSASGTWLDRVELKALEALAGRRAGRTTRAISLYGYFAEMFSVGPLAAIVATLLTKRLPELAGPGTTVKEGLSLNGGEIPGSFATLVSDWSGLVSGVQIEKLS